MKPTRDDSDDLRRHIDAYSGFVMANLLWAVVGMFIITLPIATVGLFAVMSERVRGRQPETVYTFVTAVRERWRTATIIGLLDAAVFAFLLLNINILAQMPAGNPMQIVSGAVTLCTGLIVLSMNAYIWPLLALETLSPRRVLQLSFSYALAYPLQTFAMLAVAAAVIAGSLLLPRAVLVLATASAVAYILAWGSWRVIRRHLTPEEYREYAGGTEDAA